MTNSSLPANNVSTPQEEMDALLAMADQLSAMSLEMTGYVVPGIALSKQSLDMTHLCLDVKDQLRRSFIQMAQAVAAAAPPTPAQVPVLAFIAPGVEWIQGIPLTPDQLEASNPPGICDDSAWQVVCIGREPGMYISFEEANSHLTGVPNQFRQKKSSRIEALAFYRARYLAGKVEKWNEGRRSCCARRAHRGGPCAHCCNGIGLPLTPVLIIYSSTYRWSTRSADVVL
ncbi:hypothetical protein B0H10DRAFT_2439074 [Mycena sp. CBHHK59/15]|nr:hypothetical protein B0H10DRAFT_2439074 [Mycena sp. CBHHK59/15]